MISLSLSLVPIQLGALEDPAVVRRVGKLIAFVVAAGAVSALSALAFRWYTREPVPIGVATLLGLSVVAIYLNTVGLFTQLVGSGSGAIFELDVVVFNVATIGLAAVVAPVGRRIGDRIATDVFAVAGVKDLDAEVSRIVRTVGRVTSVTIPDAEDIEDMESYDPVAADVKAEMAGKALLFPNRLTVEELHDRLITRLKDDYRVGYVDVELTERGEIEYLAVGSRAAGIGPTLGHGSVAVSLRADPANAASPGDIVQVWRPARVDVADDGTEQRRPPERLLTGELRARADDVVTLAVDEKDAEKLDASTTYRLISLPAEPQVDREFASLLRAADETMAAVSIEQGSAVVGETLGALDVTVAAIRSAAGGIEAIPTRARPIQVGDTLYIVARPEVLRRLEARTNVVVDVPPSAESTLEASVD
ncbi:TrkA C-terminal domain-containing protein [Salinigranum salinum]|uniref:TrkA C-terminal domain-containing protein n=1 Tax=Salinigranum salinum TaxID=1364937 RepID=UPI001260E965|nr:TrkA C-terminal domain-containing protein [Salinigranum salinum]